MKSNRKQINLTVHLQRSRLISKVRVDQLRHVIALKASKVTRKKTVIRRLGADLQ